MKKYKKLITIALFGIIGIIISLVFFSIWQDDDAQMRFFFLQPFTSIVTMMVVNCAIKLHIITKNFEDKTMYTMINISNIITYTIYGFLIINIWQKEKWNKKKKITILLTVIFTMNLISLAVVFLGYALL